MQQQIQFMSEVRDCWVEAENQLKPKPIHPPIAAVAPGKSALEDRGPTAEWSA